VADEADEGLEEGNQTSFRMSEIKPSSLSAGGERGTSHPIRCMSVGSSTTAQMSARRKNTDLNRDEKVLSHEEKSSAWN